MTLMTTVVVVLELFETADVPATLELRLPNRS